MVFILAFESCERQLKIWYADKSFECFLLNHHVLVVKEKCPSTTYGNLMDNVNKWNNYKLKVSRCRKLFEYTTRIVTFIYLKKIEIHDRFEAMFKLKKKKNELYFSFNLFLNVMKTQFEQKTTI